MSEKKKSKIKYRAIIRISYDGENRKTAAVRNKITAKLNSAGLSKTLTGSYEAKSSNLTDIKSGVNEALDILAEVSNDSTHPSSLDHIWVCVDKVS